jgi:hypothetical protein
MDGPLAQLAEQRTLNPLEGDSAKVRQKPNPFFLSCDTGFNALY